MDEKTIESLLPGIVKAYNQRNYKEASMITWFIYSTIEEEKMKLSRYYIAVVVNLLKTCL